MNFILLSAIGFALFFRLIHCQNITPIIEDLAVGTKGHYTVHNQQEYILEIVNFTSSIEEKPPRIYLSCQRCVEDTPVLVVVRQRKGVLSWELPLVSSSPGDDVPSRFFATSRTLCPYDMINNGSDHAKADENPNLSISLSTSSIVPVQVTLSVTLEADFMISFGEEKKLKLTPATPRYFLYKFPADKSVDSVFLRVQSDDDSCMTVSVQHVHCPVYDLERNVEFDGYWQSVTRSSGFTITRNAFPDGFYAVFVAHAHDGDCARGVLQLGKKKPHKQAVISLHETISLNSYLEAVFAAVLGLALFCSIISILAFFYMRNLASMYPQISEIDVDAEQSISSIAAIRQNRRIEPISINSTVTEIEDVTEASNQVAIQQNSPRNNYFITSSQVRDGEDEGQASKEIVIQGSYGRGSDDEAQTSRDIVIQRNRPNGSLVVTSPQSELGSFFEDAISRTDSSLDETDFDHLLDIEYDKDTWRSKAVLFVSDLSMKTPTVLGKKASLYLWYLITVAVFYFLPVVQLVITYQKVLHTTGNQNLCYYNFLCAHPLGILSDFNHVYSNIGYLVLGGLFMVLTRRRQMHHNAAVLRNKAVNRTYGIPPHFGLFYAMGTALIVEGVLSACYHVCPNHYNFQFDTSFMYVISTMCMLKIYHARHPDISAGAYATFAMLAATILFGMSGVLYGTPVFWSIFTFIHLLICFILSIQIYYLGRFRIGQFSFRRVVKDIYIKVVSRQTRAILPTFPSRFFIILAANAVNWALAVLGPMYKIGDFATYLLAIFMVNLMLYCTFYIIMKICSGERIGRTPALFICFSVISWSASLYFFINKSISWKLTPAESKLYNQPCKVLDFYDNHDIWHFLSAASMFFSFMVLLTLDDDLLDVPRKRIAVF